MNLWGNVCIRNGLALDYPFTHAIRSLLPVCENVVVCDGESDDGTQELIRDWMKDEPKIVLCVYPWPHPVGDPEFWVKWINFAREHIKSDFQIQLDADEVLSEKSYDEVLRRVRDAKRADFSLWCKRYNFYQDDKHLIPHGVCLSHKVVRLAPTSVWMPSDGPHPSGNHCVEMAIDSNIEIFHYGFLREKEAYFAKSRDLQKFFFGSYDPRLKDMETVKGNWMPQCKMGWENQLLDFKGEHPQIIREWLSLRLETLTLKSSHV